MVQAVRSEPMNAWRSSWKVSPQPLILLKIALELSMNLKVFREGCGWSSDHHLPCTIFETKTQCYQNSHAIFDHFRHEWAKN